jgi:hypothetical protein
MLLPLAGNYSRCSLNIDNVGIEDAQLITEFAIVKRYKEEVVADGHQCTDHSQLSRCVRYNRYFCAYQRNKIAS